MVGRKATGAGAREGQGYGMLRNKVGIKKMITDNGLVLFMSPV